MSTTFVPTTVRLREEGLAKVLGELEAQVLDSMWECKEGSVRCIRDYLAQMGNDLSFNAIMTIMNRLVDKGVLCKESKGGVYTYRPCQSRESFTENVAGQLLSAVLKDRTLSAAFKKTKHIDSTTKKKIKQLASEL